MIPQRDASPEQIRSWIGADAKPTGELRMLVDSVSARLQHRWGGERGCVWIDVPKVEVDQAAPLALFGIEPPEAQARVNFWLYDFGGKN